MNALNAYLRSTGTTQRALAAALGVQPATVNHWCRGKRTPRVGLALKLAEVTGGAVPLTAWVTE